MDFVKKAVSSATGKKEEKPTDSSAQQNDDYVDKAFAAGVKKSGYNIDRNMQEKITDGAREAYEKATGKPVSDKVSN
ncbi:hypothetical protein E8E15_003444 [Penicillium rubens]|uniref:Pc21g16860 protein n=2 Tax=Penicillium chrysogenum species complex TaxID=254878 RepID=B6HLR2_PENRW|nr:uncharacterized protein N7525_008210 [Penicillium rubens]XP_056571913.1 uncharacterized protein N7489_001856 [Penicillium chrysogenum]CAP96583.1 Pc21g16860 [Penicillium rubens Wisconsin 54-1255]KAF3014861.1 hypothetical protein E8E15_003444 [Penicillium rubens]KAJ5048627.1 hypothetical protein NUH16_007132 [Penicillium rubens]KAJ5251446.1 hypothetical protein N7489_001856 [Penicillium chrysogenum]KAJ5262880.1 hypothetical protein N7524_008185 [Penicillium chrysogenum]|eukprot:CAMPEP_0178970856 /NCGR_PEP_ID=MMETSP0789-20121207/19856_1 /TAXON_ID=3005 /ORGANISM="Rhizosolenia setigera, Strain CCMP 1694" /LENGTH=76 /DNA_ID=CAMNT_0020657571 /DNA_START=47 /DNA_END=277 /DNA_ORIENTATION=-